jgi:hypothetical protein
LWLDFSHRREMLYEMQTTQQVDIVARSTHNWQSSDEEECIRRPVKSKRRKQPRAKQRAPLSADRPLSFAHEVRKCMDSALCRCEEFYPQEGPHSVLYVVVERDATEWRERLAALHRDYFGLGKTDPLAPVQLEVVDRGTHEALQRLFEAGLVAPTTRAARSLWPIDDSTTAPPPLSEAEREKAADYRRQAARKMKMAGVLAGGDLGEEAREALLDAIEPLGRALAVENRWPEPLCLEDALLPPFGPAWKAALPVVRNFLRDPLRPVAQVLSALAQV